MATSIGGLLWSQNGQQGARPGWPCVPGRAVDPAYIQVSESTGGQLFLFQRNEAAQSMVVMNASHTHPSTVLRALGNLSGDRDFEFAVDSTMKSMLILASLQCRSAIRLTRPSGAELTKANSQEYVDLQAGRIQRIDLPEPGVWKLGISGTGLFVISVLAKADVSLNSLRLTNGRLNAYLRGEASNVKFQIVDAAGVPVADLDAAGSEHDWQAAVDSPAERFRIRVTGTDAMGWPFQRTDPVLFRRSTDVK
ncbi:MAG TPA: hypothetical protein VKU19_38710 [Bryobacteraceae bacterium]|nr:hypothetical protein [Bryobacteraceae bacterium]